MRKKDIENFLKTLHGMDNAELDAMKEDELTKFLVVSNEISAMLDSAEKRVKNVLKESGFDDTSYYPEFQKKVSLKEKTETVINSLAILNGLKAINKETSFVKIVVIQKKKVEELGDSDVTKVVEDNTMRNPGDPYVSVSKMNKEELVEHSS